MDKQYRVESPDKPLWIVDSEKGDAYRVLKIEHAIKHGFIDGVPREEMLYLCRMRNGYDVYLNATAKWPLVDFVGLTAMRMAGKIKVIHGGLQ